MFVTTDQGNLCKTLHDMSINEWTKSFNLYPHFIQVLFTKIILFFFFENFQTKYWSLIVSQGKKNICREKKQSIESKITMRKKDLESTKLQTNEAFLNQNFLFYSTNEMKPRII